MIPIRDLNTYFSACVGSIADINYFYLVASEPQFANIIRKLDKSKFPALVVVIPSADSKADNEDNYGENNSFMLYIIEKYDITAETPATFLDVMERTQEAMKSLKQKLIDDKANWSVGECDNFLKNYDINSMHQDPEYQFLGCNGWSLSFNIYDNRI